MLIALVVSACTSSTTTPTATSTPTSPTTTIETTSTTTTPTPTNSPTTTPVPTTTAIAADAPLIEWYAYDTEGLIHEGWFTPISAEEGFAAEPLVVITASDISAWELRPFGDVFNHVLTISSPDVVEAIDGLVRSVTPGDYIPETDQWRFPAFRIRVTDQWSWGWVDYGLWPRTPPTPRLDYYPAGIRAENEIWLFFDAIDFELGLAARETWESSHP